MKVACSSAQLTAAKSVTVKIGMCIFIPFVKSV